MKPIPIQSPLSRREASGYSPRLAPAPCSPARALGQRVGHFGIAAGLLLSRDETGKVLGVFAAGRRRTRGRVGKMGGKTPGQSEMRFGAKRGLRKGRSGSQHPAGGCCVTEWSSDATKAPPTDREVQRACPWQALSPALRPLHLTVKPSGAVGTRIATKTISSLGASSPARVRDVTVQ